VANLESFGLPPDGSAAWNPLNEFFQNPWFQRAWIAQEFAVSPRLVMTYGDQTLLAGFAGRVRAAFLQHGLGHYLMSGNPTSEKDQLKAAKQWTRIGWLHKLRSRLQSGFSVEAMEMTSLLRLLNRNIRHCASDPRDQVYALLGLAYDGGASELDPRYDQAVTKIYIQTCRYFVSKNQVEFLHATGAPHKIPGLPSLDWPVHKLGTSLYKNISKVYHPTIPLDSYLRLSPDSRILTCCGEILDSLQTFTSEF
jgi:hypothetical protein